MQSAECRIVGSEAPILSDFNYKQTLKIYPAKSVGKNTGLVGGMKFYNIYKFLADKMPTVFGFSASVSGKCQRIGKCMCQHIGKSCGTITSKGGVKNAMEGSR